MLLQNGGKKDTASEPKTTPTSRPHCARTQVKNAPWGLSRIVSKKKPSTYDGSYRYPSSAGRGVTIYIIDTGIYVDHEEYEGRAVWGKSFATFEKGHFDGNGHGTHVAGIAAGKSFGVAKHANVVAVKVLDSFGDGYTADIIKGIEWVVQQHELNKKKGGRSVANLSLGANRSKALNAAVDAAIADGVHFAVAAGNYASGACDMSPASSDKPLTVAASTENDTSAWFTNYGKCVDLYAPGDEITSAYLGSRTATEVVSGTSMASPHAAGVMALYLGTHDYTPEALKAKILNAAAENVLTDLPPDTPSKLLSIEALLEKYK